MLKIFHGTPDDVEFWFNTWKEINSYKIILLTQCESGMNDGKIVLTVLYDEIEY